MRATCITFHRIPLVRPWHPEDLFCDKGVNKIRRDRGNTVQAGLAKLPLNVELRREPVATVRLHAHVPRLPRCVSCQKLGHVALDPSADPRVDQRSGLAHHQRRGLERAMGVSYRERDSLVGPDGSAKHHPVSRVCVHNGTLFEQTKGGGFVGDATVNC